MSNYEGSVDAKPSNTPLVEQVRPESWVTQINEIGELQQTVQWYRHSNRDEEKMEAVDHIPHRTMGGHQQRQQSDSDSSD